ncbi:MAG TPA: hypothetical protein VIG32_09230 [Candidatus Baltobacteraceae bacterium]|jgi:hypothetical protein
MRANWCLGVPGVLFAGMLFCAPARATVSVAGGGFVQNSPSTAGGAVIVSSGASIPAFPLELQGSLLVPLTKQGGYAATAEIRGFTGGGYGGAYIGAGAGVGDLSGDRTEGPILTVFAGKSIAKHTAIEVRLYRATSDGGATAGFLGLRFSL